MPKISIVAQIWQWQHDLKTLLRGVVKIVSVRMKMIWHVALLVLLATFAQAQNVFLLGSNTTPPPDLNGYVPTAAPAVAAVPAAPAGVTVNVNVNGGGAPACTSAACDPYSAQYYNAYYPQYYSPNVMYVGGPGTCGPNYYNYYPNYSSSVIYFGGLQAYRHGYNFRHCR
jgi:hypothetical protein